MTHPRRPNCAIKLGKTRFVPTQTVCWCKGTGRTGAVISGALINEQRSVTLLEIRHRKFLLMGCIYCKSWIFRAFLCSRLFLFNEIALILFHAHEYFLVHLTFIIALVFWIFLFRENMLLIKESNTYFTSMVETVPCSAKKRKYGVEYSHYSSSYMRRPISIL